MTSATRIPERNGIGTTETRLRPSGLEKSADWNACISPSASPKKSPSGTSTAGVAAPSHVICSRSDLSITGLRSLSVSHMRRTIPLVPEASAIT